MQRLKIRLRNINIIGNIYIWPIILFLLLIFLVIIVSYQMTSSSTEKFKGADYYFNILVQLAVSIISAFIFYIAIEFILNSINTSRTLKLINLPLRKICYISTNMYKNILNEDDMIALRMNYSEDNGKIIKETIKTLEMKSVKNRVSSSFMGDSNVFFYRRSFGIWYHNAIKNY